jgi:hypothetical protein
MTWTHGPRGPSLKISSHLLLLFFGILISMFLSFFSPVLLKSVSVGLKVV